MHKKSKILPLLTFPLYGNISKQLVLTCSPLQLFGECYLRISRGLMLNSFLCRRMATDYGARFYVSSRGNVCGISLGGTSQKLLFIKHFSPLPQEDDEKNVSESSDNVSEKYATSSGLNEVQRVCKIIDDLFAIDRGMEVVLDKCNISLSHLLVLDVLGRFCHAWKPAIRFFSWAGQKPGFSHNSDTYNCMMNILGKTRQFESMISLLEEMGQRGLLTIRTFIISIRAFAAAKEMKKAVGVFELMKTYNFDAGVDTFNCLLDELGKAKLGKEAQILFDKLKGRFQPNLQSYTVLLAGWCNVKNLVEAGKVWNEMTDKGFKPDIVTFNIMLEGLLKGQRQPEAIKLLDLMKAKGPQPDAKSYTILLRHLCKRGKMELASSCFNEMLEAGCSPDTAVYTCLIAGFGNENRMDVVFRLLKDMKERGCPPDALTYNALIKLKTARNMPDDAVRIYKMMVRNGFEPTIHTFNMLMKCYFRARNYSMGCAVWEEMRKKGCCPDDNSYTVYIAGLVSNGKTEEACKCIEEMVEKGMKIPLLDYTKFAAYFIGRGERDLLNRLAQKLKLSGKPEESDALLKYAQSCKNRVGRSL